MKPNLLSVGRAVLAASALLGATALADEVVSTQTFSRAPVARETVIQQNSTTTTTTDGKLSHREKERLHREKEYREKVDEAKKHYLKKVREAEKDLNDD